MKQHTRDTIARHGREAYPREACGCIVSIAGAETVILCRNISEHPTEHFTLHPEDYLAATRKGTVIGIWHTHPVTTSSPSQADRTACNRSGLPWHIYSMHEDRLHTLYPAAAETPLCGRKFVWGVHDCWTLVRDYYRQILHITLPFDETYPERFWEKGRDYYARLPEIGFVKMVDQPPREHDLLTMQIMSPIPNHGAVLLGDGNILHHLENRLSCPDVYGGYWREITCGVWRHKELL